MKMNRTLTYKMNLYKKYNKLLNYIHDNYIIKYNFYQHHCKTSCEDIGEICISFFTTFNQHSNKKLIIYELEKLSIMLEGNIVYDYKARSILFKFSEPLIDIFNDSERLKKFNNILKNSNKFYL